jgi:hypothetical protein
MNIIGQGNWSSVSYFTTIGGPPVMTLVSPVKAANITKDSVRLIWNKAPQGATQYALQLAVDSAMTIFIINNATYTDTSLMVRALSPGTNYWWRVKGYNSLGWGTYSAINTFKRSANRIQFVNSSSKNVFALSITGNALRFTLPSSDMVSAQVFDLRGCLVATPVSMFAQAGTHDAALPASLPSGRYLLQFKAGANTISRPVVIIN